MSLNPNSPFFHEERHSSLAAISDKRITLCGAGALGGNLTENLARMGFNNLKIIDRDRVESRNLSTQPYNRAEVGAPKAKALATMLYRAVQAKIESAVVELTATNAEKLLIGSAVVVDAFDNREARAAVSETTLKLGIPCLHIGFSPDGLYSSGLWEPDYKVPEATGDDPCDYPLTRPMAVMFASLAARFVSEFLSTGLRTDFELTWKDLNISLQVRHEG